MSLRPLSILVRNRKKTKGGGKKKKANMRNYEKSFLAEGNGG